jgi:hypothetical protein
MIKEWNTLPTLETVDVDRRMMRMEYISTGRIWLTGRIRYLSSYLIDAGHREFLGHPPNASKMLVEPLFQTMAMFSPIGSCRPSYYTYSNSRSNRRPAIPFLHVKLTCIGPSRKGIPTSRFGIPEGVADAFLNYLTPSSQECA